MASNTSYPGVIGAQAILVRTAFFTGRSTTRSKQQGVTPRQVQIVWLSMPVSGKSWGTNLPPEARTFPADAQQSKHAWKEIVHAIHIRYPNVKIIYSSTKGAMYMSPRETPSLIGGPIEPWNHDAAWGVKWVIEDQINGAPDLNYDPARGPVKAPWLSWGPYLVVLRPGGRDVQRERAKQGQEHDGDVPECGPPYLPRDDRRRWRTHSNQQHRGHGDTALAPGERNGGNRCGVGHDFGPKGICEHQLRCVTLQNISHCRRRKGKGRGHWLWLSDVCWGREELRRIRNVVPPSGGAGSQQ